MSWQFFVKRKSQNYDIRAVLFYQVFVILRIGLKPY